MTEAKMDINSSKLSSSISTVSNICCTAGQNQASILLQPTTTFLSLSYAIAIIAILLNIIEIRLIVRKIMTATDFEIVLLDLAIADLLNSIVFVVVTIITQKSTHGKELRFGLAFYWIIGVLAFSVTASMSFVIVIGVERFFAIKVPLQHRLWHTSRTRLITYIVLTWLFNVILIVTMLLIDHLAKGKRRVFSTSELRYGFAGILIFGSGLILVLYAWVLHLMMQRSLKSFDFDTKILRISHKIMKEAMKKEKSSIVICVLVVVSFLGCNMPLVPDLLQSRIKVTSAIFLRLSAIHNPLIYFFKGYLEKYYAKKTLVPLAHERGYPKENENGVQRSNSISNRSHVPQGRSQREENITVVEHMVGVNNYSAAAEVVSEMSNKK